MCAAEMNGVYWRLNGICIEREPGQRVVDSVIPRCSFFCLFFFLGYLARVWNLSRSCKTRRLVRVDIGDEVTYDSYEALGARMRLGDRHA